jgi:hypothetical protein
MVILQYVVNDLDNAGKKLSECLEIMLEKIQLLYSAMILCITSSYSQHKKHI